MRTSIVAAALAALTLATGPAAAVAAPAPSAPQPEDVPVVGRIHDRWLQLGGPMGAAGLPVAPQTCTGDVCTQRFTGGVFYWSAAHDVHVALGAIAQVPAGVPIADQRCELAGGGCAQDFEHGTTVYWSPRTGAHPVENGLIGDYWKDLGGPAGPYGYPLGSEECSEADAGGNVSCSQRFEGGWIRATSDGIEISV